MADHDSNYQEFFGARRRALDERIKQLDQQIQRLQSERNETLAELEKLIKAMQILEATPTSASQKPPLTIKQGVLRVLESAPDGLTAIGILKRLKLDFDLDYERTSLSPQLSRLKREKKIKLDGGIWSLSK